MEIEWWVYALYALVSVAWFIAHLDNAGACMHLPEHQRPSLGRRQRYVRMSRLFAVWPLGILAYLMLGVRGLYKWHQHEAEAAGLRTKKEAPEPAQADHICPRCQQEVDASGYRGGER